MPLTSYFAIAEKCCQYILMAKVLAPGLEFFGGFTNILAELDEGFSEAVRIEIRQTRMDEGFAKYLANRGSTAPVSPIQPCDTKLAVCPQFNPR